MNFVINEDDFEDVLTDLRKLRAKRAIRLLQKQSGKAGMGGMLFAFIQFSSIREPSTYPLRRFK
jgi:hypothetical protein